jgi:F-type H+-transporting ATPase subunit gamma
MPNLEELRETIHNTRDLDTVVRTMRALAMVNARQYDTATAALAAYGETIRLGLRAVLWQRRLSGSPMGSLPPASDLLDRPVQGQDGLILFGSDHGLCGPFNEQILERAGSLLGAGGEAGQAQVRPAERGTRAGEGPWRILVVGTKLAGLFEATGRTADVTLGQPHGLAGVEELMADLLMAIEAWRQSGPLRAVWLLHHRCRSAEAPQPVLSRLLPIDEAWLQEMASGPWDSRSLPQVQGDWGAVLAAVLREHLAHQLSEACVASLAAENTARLLAMQGARGHIEDRLAELSALYRQQRQSAITEELLDVVAGFEALNDTP